MASCSISAALFSSLPVANSHTICQKPKPSLASLPSPKALKLKTLKSSQAAKVSAAPEALDAQETLDGPDSGAVEMAPKQKIRIKLRSYWVSLIEDSCKQIMDAARTTNAKTMGPVPLPTKKRIYCVLKSPHVHKDARFHFEIRTHQRLIDILYPTAQTIDSLMQLDLPAGVDVEVKL
ncbi:30S ribosomal protein S10, chloroplastic [Rhodamnia argentea]|uniref:Small ribosomal subunit protein uS10c n=1 Tax=Rhodamnia argentea TaxID=178133 RepID=A0A8B8P0J4_9MYRT|nr:30S ribosomal protein S10, chloroplastic [Rhodamnia argentea]